MAARVAIPAAAPARPGPVSIQSEAAKMRVVGASPEVG